MGVLKHRKSEGGQGGRRGHSNLSHWITTEEIKAATHLLRRREARQQIAEQVHDLTEAATHARRERA
jgi:hypothetical protein